MHSADLGGHCNLIRYLASWSHGKHSAYIHTIGLRGESQCFQQIRASVLVHHQNDAWAVAFHSKLICIHLSSFAAYALVLARVAP